MTGPEKREEADNGGVIVYAFVVWLCFAIGMKMPDIIEWFSK